MIEQVERPSRIAVPVDLLLSRTRERPGREACLSLRNGEAARLVCDELPAARARAGSS